jgi:hypothetical protein
MRMHDAVGGCSTSRPPRMGWRVTKKTKAAARCSQHRWRTRQTIYLQMIPAQSQLVEITLSFIGKHFRGREHARCILYEQ